MYEYVFRCTLIKKRKRKKDFRHSNVPMNNPRAKSATSSKLVCTSGISYHNSMPMWLTRALRVTTSFNAGSRRKRSMLTCRVMLM